MKKVVVRYIPICVTSVLLLCVFTNIQFEGVAETESGNAVKTIQKAKAEVQLTKVIDAQEMTTKSNQILHEAALKNPNLIGPIIFKPNIQSTAVRNDKQIVPKIVHYTWFYPKERCTLKFYHLISMLSAYKFIKPTKIIVWNEIPPCGKWWDEAMAKIPTLESKFMAAPNTTIFGHKINVPEHKSDQARISIILKYGGIYLDSDMVALKSWDPLLHYDTTMGAETDWDLCSCAVIAVKNSTFIHHWQRSYRNFNDKNWGHHACIMPYRIAKAHPELIHIEWSTLQRPYWAQRQYIYKRGMLWDWTDSYGMHLYYRYHSKPHNPEDIKKMNSTLGQVFRYVYHNTTKLMK